MNTMFTLMKGLVVATNLILVHLEFFGGRKRGRREQRDLGDASSVRLH